jgi:hypothetical protein
VIWLSATGRYNTLDVYLKNNKRPIKVKRADIPQNSIQLQLKYIIDTARKNIMPGIANTKKFQVWSLLKDNFQTTSNVEVT